jgi:DNA polymerase III subunit gamma/tau
MTYVVLARKYRPRRFSEMVGQEHVVQALTNALQQQRLHHAYLFTGTRGIGKTTVSRILAKSLNCTGADGQGGITAEPCGVCSACTEIDADRYMDYIELDAASNRSIDEIRDLIERAAYKPGVGRFKVFMIDEAHQLTKDAFNALLKTLEEPPEYLKFVLATTDPEKMLPTVLSRCLQFNLRPMAPATVREHLRTVLAAESVACDEGSLRLLARAARGSMRDGLSLTDQAIAYGSGQLTESVVRTMLGSVDRGHALALVQALSQHDGAAVLATVDGLRSLGLSAAGTLEEMALLLQQMAIEQAVPGGLDAQDPDTEAARSAAAWLAADETQLLYSMALHGREELSLMGDEYAALTMVMLRFLAFPSRDAGGAAPPQEAPREVRAAPLRAPSPPALTMPPPTSATAPAKRAGAAPAVTVEARPVVTSPAVSSPPPSPPASATSAAAIQVTSPLPAASPSTPAATQITVPTSALGDRWYSIVKRLAEQSAISALSRELALQSGLQNIDTTTAPQRWLVMVERETLRSDALRDKLQAALAQELGHPIELLLQAGVPEDSPTKRDVAERAQRQADAEATIQGDPVVRELLAQFKTARIVPGSIKPI